MNEAASTETVSTPLKPRKKRRWLRRLLVAILLLVVFLYIALSTRIGSQILLSTILNGVADDAKVSLRSGSVLSGLEFDVLDLQFGTTQIQMRGLSVGVDWSALLGDVDAWQNLRSTFVQQQPQDPPPETAEGYVLHLAPLRADSIQVDVGPSAPKDPNEPPWVWQMPSLPVSLVIPHLAVDTFVVSTEPGVPLLQLKQTELSLLSHRDRYYLATQQLELQAFKTELHADFLRLYVSNQPHDSIRLDTRITGSYQTTPLTLAAHAQGVLDDLHFDLQGELEAAAYPLKMTGRYRHGRIVPLSDLALEASHVNPQQWGENWPLADLNLTLKMVEEDCLAVRLQKVCGTIQLKNASKVAGSFHTQKLPITQIQSDWAFSANSWDDWQFRLLTLNIQDYLQGKLQARDILVESSVDEVIPRVQGSLTLAQINAQAWDANVPKTATQGTIGFSWEPAEALVVDLQLRDRIQGKNTTAQGTVRYQQTTLDISQLIVTLNQARLEASGQWKIGEEEQPFSLRLRTQQFAVNDWVAFPLPESRLTMQLDVEGKLQPGLEARLRWNIDPSSRWNRQAIRGNWTASWSGDAQLTADGELVLGENRLRLNGALGDSERQRLQLEARVPQLADILPNARGRIEAQVLLQGNLQMPLFNIQVQSQNVRLPSGIQWQSAQLKTSVQGWRASDALRLEASIDQVRQSDELVLSHATASIQGSNARHRILIDGGVSRNSLSQKPYAVSLQADGQLSTDGGRWTWRQTIQQLFAQYGADRVEFKPPWQIESVWEPQQGNYRVNLGKGSLNVHLAQGHTVDIFHQYTRVSNGVIATKGDVVGLTILPDFLDLQYDPTAARASGGTVQMNGNWDLTISDTIQGNLLLKHVSGDLNLPQEPKLPIGLKQLELRLQAKKIGERLSQYQFVFQVMGDNIGQLAVNSEGVIRNTEEGWGLAPNRRFHLRTDMAMKELSWLSLFTGDAFLLGGQLTGSSGIQYDGLRWSASGNIQGKNLRFILVDQGIRLLDGSLNVSLDNETVQLRQLRFPSAIRVKPSDAKIMAWIEQPENQKGYVEATGHWNLRQHSGNIRTVVRTFPLIQRTDRFIVASGTVDAGMTPSSLDLKGDVRMDVGWVNAAIQNAARLSDDVVVVFDRNTLRKKSSDFRMNIRVLADLGEAFFVQGFGLYTGVKGKVNVDITPQGGLKGEGEVRTFDGRYRALGQELTIRRGVIRFNGPLTDPSLSINAVRRNLPVTVGVTIRGTARRPLVTLYSEPEMTDAEKLSWLVMGRSPDEGGTDIGFLVSAASSLLGTDGASETITSRLGVDELSIRTGNINSTRGIIPENTVAGDSTSSSAQVANDFLVIGKELNDSLYLTFEQALAGQEGIMRLSYKLQERTDLVARFGTVNGLELIFRILFDD